MKAEAPQKARNNLATEIFASTEVGGLALRSSPNAAKGIKGDDSNGKLGLEVVLLLVHAAIWCFQRIESGRQATYFLQPLNPTAAGRKTKTARFVRSRPL